MGWGRFLPVVVVAWASAAAAQAPWPTQSQQQAPWPGQQPQASSQQQPQGQAAWPAQQQQPQGQGAWPAQQQQPQAQHAWPSHQAAAAAPAAPMTPMMTPGVGAAPGMGSPMGRGQAPPCAAVLTKLHAEAEKRGAEAKAAQQRKVSREEFCKIVTNLVAAEGKFTKTAEQEATNCGIPPEALKQMKAGHEHLLKVKENVCSAGPAAAPPSLSEALGTDRLPLDESEKTLVKRGGVLDSMIGPPAR